MLLCLNFKHNSVVNKLQKFNNRRVPLSTIYDTAVFGGFNVSEFHISENSESFNQRIFSTSRVVYNERIPNQIMVF